MITLCTISGIRVQYINARKETEGLYEVLVYAETEDGKKLVALWDTDGNGVTAIDGLTDEESDEVYYEVFHPGQAGESVKTRDE